MFLGARNQRNVDLVLEKLRLNSARNRHYVDFVPKIIALIRAPNPHDVDFVPESVASISGTNLTKCRFGARISLPTLGTKSTWNHLLAAHRNGKSSLNSCGGSVLHLLLVRGGDGLGRVGSLRNARWRRLISCRFLDWLRALSWGRKINWMPSQLHLPRRRRLPN